MIIVNLLAIGQVYTYSNWESFSRSRDSEFCREVPEAAKMFMTVIEVV